MNTDWFLKFEEYLHGEMSGEERLIFESELSSNEEMNSAFKIYRTIESEMGIHEQHTDNESELKNSLETLNAKYFTPESKRSKKVVPLFSGRRLKTVITIAASFLILLVAYIVFLEPKQNVQLLAETYIDTHFKQLSQTMDSTPDSVQMGISAFNQQEYNRALKFFQGIQARQPENVEVIKNIGIVHLVNKDFEEALQKFNELAAVENLHSNPGIFLKAITLMKRNEKGDKQEAKRLLEQVVTEETAGSKQAKEWLEEF